MKRAIIGYLAFISIPIIWFVLNLFVRRTTFMWLIKDWNEYRKSGKPWGPFG